MTRKLRTIEPIREAVIAKPLASHPCAHDDCDRMIDLESFACIVHWSELAGSFQLEVVEVWADRGR